MTRLVAILAAAVLVACATPGAPPTQPPIRDTRLAPIVPDEAEHAAADLAAAALTGDLPGMARAADRIEAFDEEREEGPTGLSPAAADLWNSTALPGRAWRSASQALLDRNDLDPALRERIERALADDPLVRAKRSVRNSRQLGLARLFNTVAEPVGRSLLQLAMAPYRLGRSLARYALALYREDPLPLQRRQALAHWKEFLARYPDAPESEDVTTRAEVAQARWHQTRRQQALRGARSALDADRPRGALVLAERALRHSPEHEGAERVRVEAEQRLLAMRANHRRSVQFALPEGGELLTNGTRERAIAMLVPGLPQVAAAPWRGPPPSEVRYAQAGALAIAGHEEHALGLLRGVADADSDEANMVRHARAALADPVRNPYDTFVRARWRDRRARGVWLLIGPFAGRPAPEDAIGAVEAALELPRLLQVFFTLPLRLIQWPWMPPPGTAGVTAIQARRYLRLAPEGAHAGEVLDWLLAYERGRNNHLGALRVAEQREPNGDHAALREGAARQTLRVASRETRRDLRLAMLAGVTRLFPETEAGEEAGRRVREEFEAFTPQRIVITRGFLEENPEVTGVRGLDLDPQLLDGDGRNGEIHPDGLALVGGRVLEIAYLGPSGDEKDPPEKRHERLSETRFARLVARLEETSFRNALLDEDDPIRPNAQRDHVFERARLGLSDEIDTRPTAQSHYTYRGMRERYGVVRRREPLLPFDLVLQGSLSDLSLGAFPRMRGPEQPEDAILYE